MKKPIKFSPEFRQAAVNRVLDGETQAEVAKSLGINSKTLHVWCRKAKESRSETANIKIDETARLRLELKKAKAEIEFLKKSLEPDSLSRGKRQNFLLASFVIRQTKQSVIVNNFY